MLWEGGAALLVSVLAPIARRQPMGEASRRSGGGLMQREEDLFVD